MVIVGTAVAVVGISPNSNSGKQKKDMAARIRLWCLGEKVAHGGAVAMMIILRMMMMMMMVDGG